MTRSTQERAATAAGFLESAQRPDGTEYTRKRDNAPEWVAELVHAGHGDDDGDNMMPDDWRYKTIAAALEAIAETDGGLEDGAHDFADAWADVYNSDLAAWLASHNYRAAYCDAAAEEYGEAGTTWARVQRGQYYESVMVYRLVLAALEGVTA